MFPCVRINDDVKGRNSKTVQVNRSIHRRCTCVVVSFVSACSVPSCLLTDNNVTGCGNWSAWSDWTACPDSCDSRSRNRTRTCDDGSCGGDDIEFETCATKDCSGTYLFTYSITSISVSSRSVELPPGSWLRCGVGLRVRVSLFSRHSSVILWVQC